MASGEIQSGGLETDGTKSMVDFEAQMHKIRNCATGIEKNYVHQVDQLGAWKTHGWGEMMEYIIMRLRETHGKDAKGLRTQKEFMSAVPGGVRKRRAVEKEAKMSKASAPDKRKEGHVVIIEELDAMEITDEDYQDRDNGGYASQDEESEGDPNLGEEP
ncbi:hypothetical protein TWF730_006171 [Orbilia blumenaviensis]|uniref:Uncharacterized protein n=1 Tax=Orbilia blumenaviensis TaxID=1796055 RepID=A0AAV9TXG5_9PEZI